jgi:hypothetical protein
VTKFELNVLEVQVIFLKAEDSFKESDPIFPKFKKFKIFLLSKGKSNKCAGVTIASVSLF